MQLPPALLGTPREPKKSLPLANKNSYDPSFLKEAATDLEKLCDETLAKRAWMHSLGRGGAV